VVVPVSNTGSRDGEEVVQVYLSKVGDEAGPVKTLRAFKRVSVPAGKTVNVHITLSKKDLEWWNEATHSIQFCPGEYQVWIGNSSDEKALSKYAVQLK
jgi:hypothetical protein